MFVETGIWDGAEAALSAGMERRERGRWRRMDDQKGLGPEPGPMCLGDGGRGFDWAERGR